MFRSSAPFLLFDYFRVPYRLAPESSLDFRLPPGAGWLQPDRRGHGSAVLYSTGDRDDRTYGTRASLAGAPILCRLQSMAETRALLETTGGAWAPEIAITDDAGKEIAAVWRERRGSVFLPFDPHLAIESFWSESYAKRAPGKPSPKRLAMHAYYRVRPALPRAAQIALRRSFSRIQARARFPRWPVETGLHDLYDTLLRLCADVAGEPIPSLAPWPSGKTWALCVTHDVETAAGYAQIALMRDIERSVGYRSSWNLIPRRYDVDDETVRVLQADGFEVGVHGLYHDGRDLESERTLLERLPAIREYAERWGAVGFRSPATHRDWGLMPMLGFDYDSSSPDTDPFEPQSGGCCTWWPFSNGDLVELPITLVQDHTLFVILKRSDERLWVEKADFLRDHNGLAVLITHPDYMLDEPRLASYRRFLERYVNDGNAWRALPREISAWWRRRADSRLERHGDAWRVDGPAAGEAVVELRAPSGA
jgi:hypothetical protein